MITTATVLLMLAVVFTVCHAVSDVMIAVRRMVHPKDMLFTWVSLAFLLGHVVFTGEIVEWFGLLRLW